MHKFVFCISVLALVIYVEVRCDLTVEPVSTYIKKEYQDASLMCKLNGLTGSQQWSSQWIFGNAIIDGSTDDYELIQDHVYNNSTLTVKTAQQSDLGDYKCIFKVTPDNVNVQNYASLNAVGNVDYLGTSVSVIEGNQAEIKCKPWGRPPPAVQWYKQDVSTKVVTSIGSGGRYQFGNIGNISDAILYVNNAVLDDRAYYVCNVSNSFGSNNGTILLRVKSTLAPLWPALGIIGEVIVLVLIIAIYELYKKNKDQKEDEKDQVTNSHDSKGTDDNLRHRAK